MYGANNEIELKFKLYVYENAFKETLNAIDVLGSYEVAKELKNYNKENFLKLKQAMLAM